MLARGIVNGKVLPQKTVAVIQARMTSKRLPGKSMLELAGQPMIQHVIERAKSMENVHSVILATADEPESKPLIELAESLDIQVYAGSPNNVLERYYKAVEQTECDYVMRITGDNPFTDVAYADMLIDIAFEAGADLSSIANIPLGTAVELIKKEALDDCYDQANLLYHFEHVTPYIKEHPEFYLIERYPVDITNPFEKLRLTVDTEEDYTLAKQIYDNLYQKGEHFSIPEVINYLTQHPELTELNSSIRQKSMTEAEN